MKKTIASVLLLTMLCALCIRPVSLPQALRSMQETRAHTQWRETANKTGNDVRVYDDGLYYSETDPKNIVNLTDHMAYVDNEVILYFKDDVTAAQKQKLFDSLGASVIGFTDILNKYQLHLPSQKDFFELQLLCTKLRAQPTVQFASCNLAMQLTEDVVPDDPWLHEDGTSAADGWNDYDVYGGNWWLTATQTTSAWDYADRFHPISVGIVDSGFDTGHEDLQGKISFPTSYHQRTNYPSSHGTHVAGIISANANNKIGITGICDNAKLLCVDWEPEKSKGQTWSTNERIFTGVISLIKHGAKVVNMSLGSSGAYEDSKKFSWNFSMYFEGVLYSYTVASLLAKGYDFLIVQSAGNGSKNNEPCNSYYNGSFCSIKKNNVFTGLTGIKKQTVLDHILIVGSSTYAHKGTEFYQSSFSNYGDGVSIFAPGSYIYSTDLETNGKYSYKSGTSMAAPVAAGIAALTWSVNPALTGAEVKSILCDPKNACYSCINYYWDGDINIPTYPLINAKLSVEAALKTLGLPEEPQEPTTEEPVSEEPTSEPESIPIITTAPLVYGNSEDRIVEQFRGEIGE
ncbi:MAG: S8 family serine peptidase [Clostridia bacterium]|nr:S8 family serine peptidase [Clostridia bacterium]